MQKKRAIYRSTVVVTEILVIADSIQSALSYILEHLTCCGIHKTKQLLYFHAHSKTPTQVFGMFPHSCRGALNVLNRLDISVKK